MTRISKIYSSLIIALTAAVFLSCVKENGEKNVIKTGDRIPRFTLSGPYGEISSADFDGNRGLVVLFASYCSSCREIMDRIQEVWDELGEKEGYTIAVISRQWGDENTTTVSDYWRSKTFTMPYYLDTDRKVYDMFAEETIPRVYVTDTSSTIKWMSVGKLDISSQELITLIKEQN